MVHQLILLTSKYPCAKGEEFIEAEISHLAAKFEKVVVVPTYLQGDTTQTREMPENCELVLPVPTDDPRIRSVAKRALTALRSGMVGFYPSRLQGFPLDLRFAVKTHAALDSVEAALADADVDPSAPTVLYGYWLFRAAALAVMLRDGYFSGNAKAVSRAHRFDVYPDQGVLGHLPSRRFLAESLDRIYPISTSAEEVLSKIPGASPEKIQVARLGVKGPAAAPVRSLTGPVHFVSCSSLIPLKRVDGIARAFGMLLRAGETGFRWTHIGDSGPESLESLRTMIRDEGIDAHAEAVGRMKNSSVLDFFSRPDVNFLVNFSSSEGVPVTIMEGAAHGVPAIATDVGGTGEFVQSGRNGILLGADGDHEELVNALRRAMDMDEDQYVELSTGARDVWREMANADVQYLRFGDQLQQLGEVIS